MKRILAISLLIMLISIICISCAEPAVEDDGELGELIAQIAEIEKLAEQFFGNNTFKNTLVYIRGKRYNDFYWNTLAGSPDKDFEDYVELHSVLDSGSIRYLNSITIPSTGDEVDFVHMAGTMNMALNGRESGDLGGFAGDITQLVRDILSVEGDFEAIFFAARQQFGQRGGFDYADVLANIDAVNMVARQTAKNSPLSVIMSGYYRGLAHSKRIEEYMLNEFGRQDFDQEELRETVYQRVAQNFYIKALFARENISMKRYADHIRACCYVYADYLTGN